jgi:hypothetical protein
MARCRLSVPKPPVKASRREQTTRFGLKLNGMFQRYTVCRCTINDFLRFKLHLRPKTTSSAGVTHSLPALPENKTIIDLFADFMRYLYACTKAYIQETHANGADLWASLESVGRIEFVLSHPNGWEGAQQGQMRTAAIQAGLIPNTSEGRGRVHFVTEGEASLHFCIQSGLMPDDAKVYP